MQTGKPVKSHRLARSYFGEGITVFKEKIYQLTWTSKIGFIYDRESFNQVGTWGYQHEGWGLTHDDRYLIVSDGSDVIRFWDPEEEASEEGQQGQSFNVVREIKVKYMDGRPAKMLNELEWISGEIWANVWQEEKIIIINPETGIVRGIVDLKGLRDTNAAKSSRDDVLNGIAYNKDTGEVYVTGKRWSTLYQIQLVNKASL
jgi:glutamine cyclotransferase